MIEPNLQNRPLRIVRAACYLGLVEIIVYFCFIVLHPLNMKPTPMSNRAFGFAILGFPFACLLPCTLLLRNQRVVSRLLLLPAGLVLLIMSWGCVCEAWIADTAFRAAAKGQRHMNCAGTPLLVAIPVSYLISFPTLVISAASFGVNRWLLRSPLRVD